MSIIKINNVSKSYGELKIFDKISLNINEKEKIGIVGINGSGKSTLIKMIMNIEELDSGNIELSKSLNIGYLKQSSEYNQKDFENLSKEFFKINNELNLNIEYSKNRLENLSGGEKTKIILSSILINKPNVLILDEPTNHMDIESIEWLIKRLKSYKGTILVVSHDRYFLNETIDKIIEIDKTKLNIYYGNYDEYQRQKEQEIKQLNQKYQKEQKQKKKIKNEINKLNNWAIKGERDKNKQGGSLSDARLASSKNNAQRKAMKLSKAAKSKKTKLMQKEFMDKPFERKEIKFNFNEDIIGSKQLIKIENLSKSFNNNLIFKDVNLIINSHDKIGLIGPNGSGKTTFIKILINELKPDEGQIKYAPSIKYCYMSQDVFNLDENKTIIDLSKEYEKREYFFSNLVNMGIDRDKFNKKIKTLSLGQRMKIKLAQIIMDNYNLLILDEPTNHLDIENKKELEEALINFKGAVIVASHDKYLLEKVINKSFIFKNKTIKENENPYKIRAI